MAQRRRINVFSLSFLDAMTCGLGAVILVFMILNAAAGQNTERMTRDLSAEADRIDVEVLDAYKNLVELRNAVEATDQRVLTTSGLSRRILDQLRLIEVELANHDDTNLSRRASLEKLKSDLKTLEEESKRLSALAPSDETPGDKVRTFVGDGDRQYLTGLKVGGKRVFILLDASASMLDETIVNVIRLRNMADTDKLQAKKWRQAVATVDWLTTQLPRQSLFQIYTFDTAARAVVAGSDGRWLDAGDRGAMDGAIAALKQVVPKDGTSLINGLAAIGQMQPPPDNLILVVDGLPTQGSDPPRRATVSGKDRLKLYNQALSRLPGGIPVNVILLPMEGDPMAASAFWKMAVATGGSFLSPAADWP